MKILVINSGSSSIKFELFDLAGPSSLVRGSIERIGEATSVIEHEVSCGGETDHARIERSIADHAAGLQQIASILDRADVLADNGQPDGIGHRVVHGGERFQGPTRIDTQVLDEIERLATLAPLHNPAHLLGIRQTNQAFPDAPQVAVFDTAFHQTLPPKAFMYAVPYEYYERHGIRRYGFHGTSHRYVARTAADFLQRPLESLRLITIHLGNGASMAAIQNGVSIDTSMGLTPLEGLMMGTRSGDLDPAVLPFLGKQEKLDLDELDSVLNHQSGLKGICGDNDMRQVSARADEGDDRARLAIEMYAYRIKKYIGAYLAVLGGADAIVFTAGIGEHASNIRATACAGLEPFGIQIDPHLNLTSAAADPFAIHTADSPIQVLVIPTNEELEIAQQTRQCLEG